MTTFAHMSLADFVKQAASDAPTPGGGGVAALAGALGAAMASMAANFTVGKPKFAEHDALMRETLTALTPLIDTLRQAVDDDATAFSGISEAYKLPRNDDVEKKLRQEAITAALSASMRVPLRVAVECARAAELLPRLAETGNPNLLSDVEVAGIMLEAAARAAQVNILINSRSLKTNEARAAEAEGQRATSRTAAIAAQVRDIVSGRNG